MSDIQLRATKPRKFGNGFYINIPRVYFENGQLNLEALYNVTLEKVEGVVSE